VGTCYRRGLVCNVVLLPFVLVTQIGVTCYCFLKMAFFATATRAASILLRPPLRLLPLARPCQRIVVSAVPVPVSCSFSTFRVCQQEGGFSVHDLPSFRKSPPPSCTLWVGNLPYSADEEEVRSIFAPLGELLSIRMGMCQVVVVFFLLRSLREINGMD
jgi:hypothetical protein